MESESGEEGRREGRGARLGADKALHLFTPLSLSPSTFTHSSHPHYLQSQTGSTSTPTLTPSTLTLSPITEGLPKTQNTS